MTTLRKKVLLVVSAIVIALSLVVLPGCSKQQPTKKGATTPAKKTPSTGME